jgi:hypothetical protein
VVIPAGENRCRHWFVEYPDSSPDLIFCRCFKDRNSQQSKATQHAVCRDRRFRR